MMLPITAIPGLDVLLAHPDFLQHHEPYEYIEIPRGYIPKLIKLRLTEPLDRRYDRLLKALGAALEAKEKTVAFCTVDEEGEQPRIHGIEQTWHEYQAIALALQRQNKNANRVTILTYDSGLKAFALQYGITVKTPKNHVYRGRRVVQAPATAPQFFTGQAISLACWKHNFPNAEPLHPNEFVEISHTTSSDVDKSNTHSQHEAQDEPTSTSKKQAKIDRSFSNVRCYDATLHSLEPLKYLERRPALLDDIKPRNAGQAMLFNALLAPPEEVAVILVSGAFGTGKTFLTTAAAYAGVQMNQYEHIYICPRDARLGDPIGAVPGDTTEKTQTKARPIEDALRDFFRITNPPSQTSKKKSSEADPSDKTLITGSRAYNNLIAQVANALNYFSFTPLIELGGRSLSHSFIICDEFQDTDVSQATAMATRFGEKSKIVLMGDLDQVNNPALSSQNNGLRFMIDHLADKPEVVYVNLSKEESVRHPVSQFIAQYLED